MPCFPKKLPSTNEKTGSLLGEGGNIVTYIKRKVSLRSVSVWSDTNPSQPERPLLYNTMS